MDDFQLPGFERCNFGGGVFVELQKHRNITGALRYVPVIYAYFSIYILKIQVHAQIQQLSTAVSVVLPFSPYFSMSIVCSTKKKNRKITWFN